MQTLRQQEKSPLRVVWRYGFPAIYSFFVDYPCFRG
jgi:hypothetical protein